MNKRGIEAIAGMLLAVSMGNPCSDAKVIIPTLVENVSREYKEDSSRLSSYVKESLKVVEINSYFSLDKEDRPEDNVETYNSSSGVLTKNLTELCYIEDKKSIITGYVNSNTNLLENNVNGLPYANTIYKDKEGKIKLGEVITAHPSQLEIIYNPGKSLKETGQDGINGGYFCISDPKQIAGILFMDGCNKSNVVLRDGIPLARTVFALKGKINSDGSSSVLAEILPCVNDLKDLNPRGKIGANTNEYSYNYILGAGPNLFPKRESGQESFSLEKLILANSEGFSRDILTSNRAKSAVGITDEGLVKLVGIYSRNLYLWDLSNLMKSLGCVEAMNLDGGGSSQMSVNKKSFNFEPLNSGEGARKLSTFIVIKKN